LEQLMLARAIESDWAYFEMGSELQPLDGATMAWIPGLSASPGATVIYRVDADVLADGGAGWVAMAEQAMAAKGATLCRIYLDQPHAHAEDVLRNAGYVARDELVFLDSVPAAAIGLTLRRVDSDADWASKQRFHQTADRTPDGHDNAAIDWVALERRKCSAGMEAYLAELDREVVGAVGAIWCDGFLRTKNLVVAPERRRRGVGRAMLGAIAALGAERGLSQQCVLAVKGEEGELLYRAVGMSVIGFQVEWSKPIGAAF
jgi:ribosomal protein S18 acetylase RimI-like enzyme